MTGNPNADPLLADPEARPAAPGAGPVRWLTAATLALWLVAAGALAALAVVSADLVVPKGQFLIEKAEASPWRPPGPGESVEASDEKRLVRVTAAHSVAASLGSGLLAVAVAALALAVLGTVLLVFAAQRAALRQVRAELADISAQLADLRRRAPPPAV